MPNALDPLVGGLTQQIMNHLEYLRNAMLFNVSATSPAGLAIGTGATTAVKVVNTTKYSWNGVPKSKTTAEVAFTAVTMDIPANAASIQEAVFLVLINAAGTLSLLMGAIATGSGNALTPGIPIPTDAIGTGGLTALGSVRIAVAAAAPGAGTNFVAGTTALSDGRLTVTYTDFTFPPIASFLGAF